MEWEQMSVEEKLAKLCETDKAYILGFIDGALSKNKKNVQQPKGIPAKDKKETK